MDHIDKILMTVATSHVKFGPSICAALIIVKNAINHYYSKTDQSNVYQIAMGKFLLYFTCQSKLMAFSTPSTT